MDKKVRLFKTETNRNEKSYKKSKTKWQIFSSVVTVTVELDDNHCAKAAPMRRPDHMGSMINTAVESGLRRVQTGMALQDKTRKAIAHVAKNSP